MSVSSSACAKTTALVLACLCLGACGLLAPAQNLEAIAPNASYSLLYDAELNEKFPIPPADISRIDEQFLRKLVHYVTSESPGSIIIDTRHRHLYLVQENGYAMRYGIGVGAEGMKWSGRARVGRKAEWPQWTPTQAMIQRDPERNGPWAKGMSPGPENPLGARALYLHQDARDTLYRIHGTNEPHTIGHAVSSGCIRMLNQDIIDLYRRVTVGAHVIVLPDLPDETSAMAQLDSDASHASR